MLNNAMLSILLTFISSIIFTEALGAAEALEVQSQDRFNRGSALNPQVLQHVKVIAVSIIKISYRVEYPRVQLTWMQPFSMEPVSLKSLGSTIHYYSLNPVLVLFKIENIAHHLSKQLFIGYTDLFLGTQYPTLEEYQRAFEDQRLCFNIVNAGDNFIYKLPHGNNILIINSVKEACLEIDGTKKVENCCVIN